MKTPTTHLALTTLEIVSYEVTVAVAATRLVPPVIPITESRIINNGINFTATVPKWLREGMVLSINGAIGRKVAVSSIAANRLSFSARAMGYAVTATSPEPTVVQNLEATADFHAQRAIIQVPAAGATVTIAPEATVTYGYRPTIAGGAEKEIVAPHGAKFDMSDWYATVGAATQVVRVMLL